MAPIPERVLVVGLARSGRAAVTALRAPGTAVVAYDADPGTDVAGIDGETRLGAWHDAYLDGVGLLVKSPGVPAEAAPVEAARTRGIPVISEIELGARLLANPILGVTGTNGKTTTTALLGAMFDAAARPVEVAGNIGRPLTSLVGVGGSGRLGRLRALVLPARGRRHAAATDRRAPEPGARPPRPARHVRGLQRGEAAHLREPGL